MKHTLFFFSSNSKLIHFYRNRLRTEFNFVPCFSVSELEVFVQSLQDFFLIIDYSVSGRISDLFLEFLKSEKKCRIFYVSEEFKGPERNSKIYSPFETEGLLETLKNITFERKLSDSEINALLSLEGISECIKNVRNQIYLASTSDIPVLFTGESGTGKSLAAAVLHSLSSRKHKSLLMMDMTSIPESISESALFGTVKGAFTDARNIKGIFEEADGGTVFLDEIGELQPGLQSKLLIITEKGLFKRVGENFQRKCDVRLILATNRNLSEMVKEKLFRKDLYYRICKFEIRMPSLCERKEDIPLLAENFLKARKKILTSGAKKALVDKEWPGNIRQLFSTLEKASLECELSEIDETYFS